MRQKIFTYVIIGIFSFLTFGCEKDEINSDGKVELYLLESYSKIDNSFQIDEATIKTQTSPLISYADFISYDSTNYTFELSDRAKNMIENMEHSVHGVAFAVKADKTIIYSGYFWPNIGKRRTDQH